MNSNNTQIKQTVSKVNELYILYRKEYLLQYSYKGGGAGYTTIKAKNSNSYTLTDYTVEQHLKEKRTIGVKLGSQGLTKFLVFDIDKGDTLEEAKLATEELAEHLNSYYSIPLDKIQIHFSGGKGWHITLFFDEILQDTALYPFYKEAITTLGYKENEIEFRASSTQGVKLPLSIHRGTGNYMNFYKYIPEGRAIIPLTKEESIDYFNSIEPMNTEDFREYVLNEIEAEEQQKKQTAILEQKTAEDYQALADEVNIEGRTEEGTVKELTKVLEAGTLLYEGTRHSTSFQLLKLLREQGYEQDEAIELIKLIITNTFDSPITRELIDKSTTKAFALKEIDRLSTYVYRGSYSLHSKRKDVYISKEEIIEVLQAGRWQHQKLLFSMLLHSKRYKDENNEFYMPYSIMEAYGNAKDRSNVLKHLQKLEEDKKIKIVSRNELDTIQTKIYNSPIKKANVYKVIMKSSEANTEEQIKIKSTTKISLPAIASQLLSQQEARELSTRRIYESHFKELYTI